MAGQITDLKFTKNVDSYIALQSESNVSKSLYSAVESGTLIKDLTFTLCDRDDASSRLGNYFSSFNLPTSASKFTTASTLSKEFPELQQLNVDNIVVCPIPASYYSEFIDGRTVSFSVPQNGGADQDNMSAITLHSSNYSSDILLKTESSPLLGNNVVFLFSDDINTPYTGLTINSQGVEVDHAENSSWMPTTDWRDKPAAVSYREAVKDLQATTYNTDTRTGNYSVDVPQTYPEGRAGYNYDVPVGFVVLDKGYAVLTHTAVTENIPWTSGFTSSDDLAYTSGDKEKIYFTGTTPGSSQEAALMTFDDVDTTFKMSTVCLAMPREFYVSSNPTWDRTKVVNETLENTGFINYDSVYVTEIGLYNVMNELIAIAKLSEPVEKNYTNVITFNVDIEM